LSGPSVLGGSKRYRVVGTVRRQWDSPGDSPDRFPERRFLERSVRREPSAKTRPAIPNPYRLENSGRPSQTYPAPNVPPYPRLGNSDHATRGRSRLRIGPRTPSARHRPHETPSGSGIPNELWISARKFRSATFESRSTLSDDATSPSRSRTIRSPAAEHCRTNPSEFKPVRGKLVSRTGHCSSGTLEIARSTTRRGFRDSATSTHRPGRAPPRGGRHQETLLPSDSSPQR
jgi:hypothetical protein